MSFSYRNSDGVQNSVTGCDEASREFPVVDSMSTLVGAASNRPAPQQCLQTDDLGIYLEQALQHVWATVARIPFCVARTANNTSTNGDAGSRASVELTGDLTAQLTLHADAQLARYLTEQFLSGIETDIEGHMSDTLREVANLVGGTLKSRLEAAGLQLTLSIPVSGKQDSVTLWSESDRDTLNLKAMSRHGSLAVSFSSARSTCPSRP